MKEALAGKTEEKKPITLDDLRAALNTALNTTMEEIGDRFCAVIDKSIQGTNRMTNSFKEMEKWRAERVEKTKNEPEVVLKDTLRQIGTGYGPDMIPYPLDWYTR